MCLFTVQRLPIKKKEYTARCHFKASLSLQVLHRKRARLNVPHHTICASQVCILCLYVFRVRDRYTAKGEHFCVCEYLRDTVSSSVFDCLNLCLWRLRNVCLCAQKVAYSLCTMLVSVLHCMCLNERVHILILLVAIELLCLCVS